MLSKKMREKTPMQPSKPVKRQAEKIDYQHFPMHLLTTSYPHHSS
jgi:hypothetical protein